MRYEPVGYIYEMEIGALAVFLVIMLRYFSVRRFPNQRNRLYALILWVTVAELVLDIFSALIIDNIFRASPVVTSVINTSFYAITVLMLVFMMLYLIQGYYYARPMSGDTLYRFLSDKRDNGLRTEGR